MSLKPRLDEILVRRGFFPDLHAAQVAIMAGEVVVGEHRETSCGIRLDPEVFVRVKGRRSGCFVSRGGHKLAGALKAFAFDPTGMRCVDLGASTGGFTDCLLQAGAAHVTAIDVGYGQFDWSLRNDERVTLYERTNVNGIDPSSVGAPFDLAVADLSFIPLERVLDDVASLLRDQGSFIVLVKPQFEVAKDEVGQGGVVSDPDLHLRVLKDVLAASARHGLQPHALAYSPITGPKGNIEFLLWARRQDPKGVGESSIDETTIRKIVEQAHLDLEVPGEGSPRT